MSKKNNKNSSNHLVAWGAGIGALVAGTAGAFFLYGTEAGKKQRKKIKSWSLKMKGDVLAKLENLKEVNEKVYHDVVDNVAARYQKLKNVDSKELSALVSDMKRHWKNIQKEISGPKTSKKKSSTKKKSTSKKTAKKKSSK